MTAEDVLEELMVMHRESAHIHGYYVYAVKRIRAKMRTSQQPAQKQQEFIHDPAEIRRVFEIDAAEWPEPESGFAKL